jgi:hypothetical protein
MHHKPPLPLSHLDGLSRAIDGTVQQSATTLSTLRVPTTHVRRCRV